MSNEFTCYELLHGGEGPRGREVLVITAYTNPSQAAEEAADYFEGIDMRDQAYGFTEADGTEQYIEVRDCGKYAVVCEVKRHYHARELANER